MWIKMNYHKNNLALKDVLTGVYWSFWDLVEGKKIMRSLKNFPINKDPLLIY